MGNSNSNQHDAQSLPFTGIPPRRDPIMSEYLALPRVSPQELHTIYDACQLDELNRALGEEMIEYWKNQCQNNSDNADAQSCLAAFYHLGLSGTSRSPQKAYNHYKIAAHAGHPVAQYMICGLFTCNAQERNQYARLLTKEEFANTVVGYFTQSAAESSHYTFAHNDLWDGYDEDAPYWRTAVKNLIRSHRAIVETPPENTNEKSLGKIYNELGYLIAMVNLVDGKESTQQYQEAVQYFEKAASEYGNPAGYLNLANMMYSNGLGVDKSDVKVLEYRQKAANAGHSRALFLAATQVDTSAVKEKKKADLYIGYLNKSLTYTFTKNCLLTALNCLSGNGGHQPEMAKGVHYLKMALFAQEYNDHGFSGSAAAYEVLGYLYLHGIGLEKDLAMASTCYATGASLGFASNNLYLAKMIEKRQVINATFKDAIVMYLHYAFCPNADPIHIAHARYRLGKIFNQPDQTEHYDTKRATKYFSSAAKIYKEASKSPLCLAKAYYHLGVMHQFGLGVKINLKLAHDYYQAAINRNQEQYRLYDVHYSQKAQQKIRQLNSR